MTNQEIEMAGKRIKKPSFWLLHSIGWGVYWVLFIIENTFFVESEKDTSLIIAIPLFASAFMAAVITIPLRYLYKRCWHLHPTHILMLVVGSCVLASLVWTPAKNITMTAFNQTYKAYQQKSEMPQETDKGLSADRSMSSIDKNAAESNTSVIAYFNSITYSLAMILAWSTLYFSINFYFRLVNEKEKHLAAQRLSHSAQIKMLRYQINPHFLFNTLNAISTLVLTGNKEKANGMLVRLSTFLRFSLDNDPEKKVELYDELKALMLYLEIEKTRFDERLNIQFEVDPKAESLLVPSLLLQPLVENCIKYAIAKMSSDGLIAIKAMTRDSVLCLEVADNGPDADTILHATSQGLTEQNEGVGIRNIKERLTVLYPERFVFAMNKNSLGGLSVTIKIPVEEHE